MKKAPQIEYEHAKTPYRIKNLGFREPRIVQDHYFGSANMLPKNILRADGQWVEWLPVQETQANDFFETYGCTVFGTNNAIEILRRQVLAGEDNYADRFTYINSDTYPPGNDPHKVAESIRESGEIPETELPFSPDIDSLDKFRSMGDKGATLLALGKEWLKKWQFLHEWVFATNIPLKDKQALLMEYLKYSPLGVSVRAWQQREDGLYFKNEGETDTHWTVLVGYVEGKNWIIFDTYPDSGGTEIKLLEWDYDFGFAKHYFLKPISASQQSTPLFFLFLAKIFALLKLFRP